MDKKELEQILDKFDTVTVLLNDIISILLPIAVENNDRS